MFWEGRGGQHEHVVISHMFRMSTAVREPCIRPLGGGEGGGVVKPVSAETALLAYRSPRKPSIDVTLPAHRRELECIRSTLASLQSG